MRIVGHGIDIIEVERIAELVERHPERFIKRVFTDAEAAHSQGRRSRAQHLAARFAAKEAALKALGTGWADGVEWTDIEVVSEASGKPTLRLHGLALERAATIGATGFVISLSHTRIHAVASVIATGD